MDLIEPKILCNFSNLSFKPLDHSWCEWTSSSWISLSQTCVSLDWVSLLPLGMTVFRQSSLSISWDSFSRFYAECPVSYTLCLPFLVTPSFWSTSGFCCLRNRGWEVNFWGLACHHILLYPHDEWLVGRILNSMQSIISIQNSEGIAQ